MEGFRAARAFVEVGAQVNDADVLEAARRAALAFDRRMREGTQETGDAITEILGATGDQAGEALATRTEGRLRDSRGRFIGAGRQITDDVIGGGADESDRSGFRMFLGLVKQAPAIGMEAASGLMGALRQGMSGPAGPYMIAALAGAAVATGPVIGTLLASGIAAGLSTGAVGGGVALALKDPEIKHAATVVGQEIGDRLSDAAEPFKASVVDALEIGRAAVARWEPQLRRIFSVSSTFLEPLTMGVTGLVDKMLPGVERLIASSGPVMDSLSSGLIMIGEGVGDLFDSLADNGPEMSFALMAAFVMIKGSIDTVTWTVNGLTEAFGFLMEIAFDAYDFLGAIGQKLQGLPGDLGMIGDKLVGMAGAVNRGEAAWDGMRNKMTGATTEGGAGVSGLSDRTKLLSLSMGAAIQQAGSLSAAFKALNGGALSAREAESQYQAAIDGVSASIKANGKTLDLNTAAGRANDAAIRTLISSTDAKAQSTYDATAATKGTAAAEEAAAKVYEGGRKQLIKNLTQILGNADAAKALADEIMGIPKKWDTKATADTKAAEAAAKRLKARVDEIDRRIDITATLTTSYGGGAHTGQGYSPGMSEGGPVHGRGPKGIDSEPRMLAPGEHVFTDEEVDAAGGHRAIERFRAMLRGESPRGRMPDKIYAVDPAVSAIGGVQRAPDMSAVVPNGTPGDRQRSATVFGPGSVTLNVDVSRLRTVDDLIRTLDTLRQTARSAYGAGVTG